MRALRFHGPGDLRLERVAAPAPGDGEVEVRVTACGICDSDLRFVDGSVRPGTVPLTLGHEIAGLVGSSRDPRWREGDPVLVTPSRPCGRCRRCRDGRPNLCAALVTLGVDVDGGLADAVVVPGGALLSLPPGVAPSVGALAMDAGVAAYHAVARRAGVAAGDAVAIFGAGGRGALGLQIAKLLGAAPVVVVDTDPEALAAAAALGADETLLRTPDTPPGRGVKLLTEGGVDVAVEFTGEAASLDAAAKSLRPGGVAVAAGIGGDRLTTLPSVLWAVNEYELRGSFGGLAADADRVLAWLADGTLVPPPIATVALQGAAARITGPPAGAWLVVVP